MGKSDKFLENFSTFGKGDPPPNPILQLFHFIFLGFSLSRPKIKIFSLKFSFSLILSLIFQILLILMHILENYPKFQDFAQQKKFRSDPRKSDPPSTEKSCLHYCNYSNQIFMKIFQTGTNNAQHMKIWKFRFSIATLSDRLASELFPLYPRMQQILSQKEVAACYSGMFSEFYVEQMLWDEVSLTSSILV